jgi:predicted XRE-type DNA-binding protein
MSRRNTPWDFWRQVDFGGPNGCWVWRGKTHQQGYGRFLLGKKYWLTHRLAWFLDAHVLPDDRDVCHKCDNPPCVNPDHMFLGSHRDNMMDASRKGRMARGERAHLAKLTSVQVLEIRRLYDSGNFTQVQLAQKFGVDKSGISRIVTRKKWSHIENQALSARPTEDAVDELMVAKG